MEQIPDDVRGIQRVCESRLSKGALLRAEVQGAEGGQDAGGLLHQAVGFPCSVPLHRNELQSGGKRAAHPLFGEKGDGIALQAGATHHRTRETEPSDCGIVKGYGSKMATKATTI